MTPAQTSSRLNFENGLAQDSSSKGGDNTTRETLLHDTGIDYIYYNSSLPTTVHPPSNWAGHISGDDESKMVLNDT